MAAGLALFETALGACGIAWNDRGLTAVLLPDIDAASTRAALRRRAPGVEEAVPPPAVASAIADIVALLAGEPRGLAHIVLDRTALPDFDARVYAVAQAIPPGETLTYGEVAARIGEPGAAQAVGRALGANPWPIVVPCHRVVAAGGRLHGFSSPGGVDTKRRMLAIEGAATKGAPLFDPCRARLASAFPFGEKLAVPAFHRDAIQLDEDETDGPAIRMVADTGRGGPRVRGLDPPLQDEAEFARRRGVFGSHLPHDLEGPLASQ
jgi:methylated-DNA-[protein]-cysteine S-methyltransferase